jgi:hypothetical protein
MSRFLLVSFLLLVLALPAWSESQPAEIERLCFVPPRCRSSGSVRCAPGLSGVGVRRFTSTLRPRPAFAATTSPPEPGASGRASEAATIPAAQESAVAAAELSPPTGPLRASGQAQQSPANSQSPPPRVPCPRSRRQKNSNNKTQPHWPERARARPLRPQRPARASCRVGLTAGSASTGYEQAGGPRRYRQPQGGALAHLLAGPLDRRSRRRQQLPHGLCHRLAENGKQEKIGWYPSSLFCHFWAIGGKAFRMVAGVWTTLR